MRIGFIGDPHFGAGFNLGGRDPETQHNTRLIDFSNTFNSIVDGFVAKNVTHIIIPGDIFETRQPSAAQISSFSKCVRRISESPG